MNRYSKPIQVFAVGTPRSGTTLLQAMLAAHPDVLSLPETHFFRKVWGRLWRLKGLGIVSPRAAARSLDRLAEEIHPSVERPDVPRWWPYFATYGRAFAEVLDAASAIAGKRAWVEKSPIHLHCLAEITRVIPEAHFVHVLRDGRDVTASFYERCLEDPERWIPQIIAGEWRRHLPSGNGADRVLAEVIDRWNSDVRLSLSLRGQPRHHVVSYQDVVRDPTTELRTLANALGLRYIDSMLRYWESSDRILGSRRRFEHMLGVTRPLHDTARTKWLAVLSEDQRRFAESRLLARGRVGAVLALESAPSVASRRVVGGR